jgi:chromosome segregation ATPase
MDPRLSPHRELSASQTADRAADDRVLSLSPRNVPAEAGMPKVTPDTSSYADAPPPDDLVGIPTTEDAADSAGQASLDRFAAELSAMIEVAACTADTLNRRLQEAGEGENRAAATSAQLQEQLRTGARMLKAFQSQIGRVEQTLERQEAYERQVADVQAKIEQCFAGIETCIDRTLESVALRLAELARTAVERFDEGIAQREVRVAELDARIAQCASGIDGICEMIEQVQGTASSAVAANQRTLEKLEESAVTSRQLLSQHDQARKSLATDLHAMRDGLRTIEEHSVEHNQSAAEALRLSAEADETLRARLIELRNATSESDRVVESVAALNDLLARLQPWETLLLSGTINDDGLPEPLAKVAGEVRQQISQDMNWLSLTMKDVAERVSQLAQLPAGGRATAQPRGKTKP